MRNCAQGGLFDNFILTFVRVIFVFVGFFFGQDWEHLDVWKTAMRYALQKQSHIFDSHIATLVEDLLDPALLAQLDAPVFTVICAV